MKLRLVGGLLFFTACANSISLEDFCEARFNTGCELNKRCRLWSSSMACPASPDTACTERLQRRVDAGVLKYDGAQARQCLDAMVRRSCGGIFDGALETGIDACDRLLVGTGKEGERCGGCEAGLMCGVSVGSGDACGTCVKKVEPAADGASCAQQFCGTNSTCDADVCVPLPGDGEACRAGSCQRPFICVDDRCGYALGQGASCFTDEQCLYGLWCRSGVCQLTEASGRACGGDVECRSGLCFEGQCIERSRIGEPCTRGCAAPGTCVNGTCERGAELGESCTDRECALGLCLQGVCRDGALECR